METDLAPCPFCGTDYVQLVEIGPVIRYVVCDLCRIKIGTTDGVDGKIPIETRWNMRKAPTHAT